MKKLLFSLFILLVCFNLSCHTAAWARGSCNGRAYVSNSYDDTVSVIDTKTNDVITTIPVGTSPINPTITPNGRWVYVSNSGNGTISVIDVRTNTVTDTIRPDGEHPSGLAFTPCGKTLVVTLLGKELTDTGFVQKINLRNGEMSSLIPVGAQPERIGISPNGDTAYVMNLVSDSMTVVDLRKEEPIAEISLGDLPFNVLVSPSGKRIYVGVIYSDYIAVVDTDTNTVVDKIECPSPNGMSFSRNYRSIYVTSVFDGTIHEISLAKGEVVRTAEAGPTPGFIRLTVDGKRGYFVRPYDSDVSVIDISTLEELDTITTGSPTSLAICHSP